ncbi:hypothetical protein B0T18DRAFT_396313 [Schizothecium vesticola]|uniref:Uncharacterized protein n=1 Tax=Schizothecium vesticola TaxID=314040 RepID=A0AA40F8Z2_9PEZI|nr:hypothetical protein B0T18DRAFT_396313 [Schizothecium vesticola]
MLPPRDSQPPTNLQAIRERHARSRASASPSESRFRRYVNRVKGACNKTTMVFEVGTRLLKDYDDDGGYVQVFDKDFDGFPQEVGFNNGLSPPRPDFAEGLEMMAFHPFTMIDEHVEGAVLYEDSPYSLTLPHLAGEWEAGGGRDMKKAELRSGYDKAALVYARNRALSFVGKLDPPGHAEVTTFTTDGTSLDFYAHYAALGEEGKVEYHQYRFQSVNVKDSHQSVNVKDSHQGHKDGWRGLRNQQDYARERSYALRDQIKEHWKRRCGRCPTGGGDAEMVEKAPDGGL